MTHDDHQRERMRVWAHAFLASTALCAPHQNADMALAEFDKRFPAPSAAAPVEPVADAVPTETLLAAEYAQGWNKGHAEGVTHGMAHHATELASLRQKARLWDAVASGKLGIYPRDGDFAVHWDIGYSIRPTAAEAVESAIAQGALK